MTVPPAGTRPAARPITWIAALTTVALLSAACARAEQPTTSAPPAPDARATPASPVQAPSSPEPPDAAASPTGGTPVTSDGADVGLCWSAPPASGADTFAWEDVTAGAGLIETLTGMHGHAAAWADVDGDGADELFVGTFADRRAEVYAHRGATGPAPDRLLRWTGSEMVPDQSFPEVFGRTSGAAFADWDRDGDLDLIVSRNGDGPPSAVYEFVEDGYVEVPEAGLPPNLGGRSVAPVHLDGDGLLDLVLVEDRYIGGQSRLYRNLGGLRFQDVSQEWGMPTDVFGLGVSTGDVSGDGLTDLFVSGSNRLFVGTGDGVREVDASVFEWPAVGNEDDVAGSAIGDVNGDGRLDIVVGHHFNSTLERGVGQPVRLFLNRTEGGDPVFVDVTEQAGLPPLLTKAPHVEFADIDNDGLTDIVTSASAGDGTVPAVFRQTERTADGVPRFTSPEGLGDPQYWVAAPTIDADHDGRLDVFALEWEPALPSLLFANRTRSANWLDVAAPADGGWGPGTRIDVYTSGDAGDPEARVAVAEVTAAQGYASGTPGVAHFGLGEVQTVDVVVRPPLGGPETTLVDLPVNQRVRLGGC